MQKQVDCTTCFHTIVGTLVPTLVQLVHKNHNYRISNIQGNSIYLTPHLNWANQLKILTICGQKGTCWKEKKKNQKKTTAHSGKIVTAIHACWQHNKRMPSYICNRKYHFLVFSFGLLWLREALSHCPKKCEVTSICTQHLATKEIMQ